MIKSANDIAIIKQAAKIWKNVRQVLLANTKPGVSLLELDTMAQNVIESYPEASCAFYQHEGFPGHICISVNEVVIHGVPNNSLLKDGDLVTFDVGIKYQRHYCDAAFSVLVGNPKPAAQLISQVCYDSLMAAIEIIKPGITNHDIASTIQDYVEQHGYEVIRNFTGHGCGNKLHEDPIISNYRSSELWFKKVTLVPNQIICIEPMILTDSPEYIIDSTNGWSVIAANKKLTAHWEHMVLITEDGCEILTN